MATATKAAKGPRMSDEAVKAKTGKTWKEWFTILDKAGATKMTHQEIVKLLNTNQGDDQNQVAVQHSRLADAKAAAKMKAHWGQALERLRKQLEK